MKSNKNLVAECAWRNCMWMTAELSHGSYEIARN